MLAQFGYLAVYAAVGLILPAGVAWLVFLRDESTGIRDPAVARRTRLRRFVGTAGEAVSRRFGAQHLPALIAFVLVAVGTLFLYLAAIVSSTRGIFALVEVAIFLGILLAGLGYAWGTSATAKERPPGAETT